MAGGPLAGVEPGRPPSNILVTGKVRWRVVGATIAVGVAFLASVYLGALVLLQRRLLFPRPSVAGAPERPEDALPVWLPTAAGPVEAWFLEPAGAAPRPTVQRFLLARGVIGH
jgi:hypothetical protein